MTAAGSHRSRQNATGRAWKRRWDQVGEKHHCRRLWVTVISLFWVEAPLSISLSLTMDFFQTGLARNARRRMLVQRPIMTVQI